MFRFLLWAILAALKPKALLVAENLCLRQQLLVLQRRQPRPYLKTVDRFFWVLASRWLGGWRNLLLVVKPKTVLKWHQRGWRLYWSWRSRTRPRTGRRAIPQQLQVLIRRMAVQNRLWGQKRIFVIRLANREILHVEVTRHPTAGWVAQQILECCAWDRPPPRFLIHDRDGSVSCRGRAEKRELIVAACLRDAAIEQKPQPTVTPEEGTKGNR